MQTLSISSCLPALAWTERPLRVANLMRWMAVAPAPTVSDDRAEAANVASVDALYERYVGFVWRNARRMGVRDADLDDVTQEVFLVVHRRFADFKARSSVETWLFGILFNVVQHYRRSKARWLNKLEALVRFGAPAEATTGCEDALERLSRRDDAAILERLLDGLDDGKRAVFLLVELEEQSVPEVAEALDVNVNTVYSRLRAARLELEKAASKLGRRDGGAMILDELVAAARRDRSGPPPAARSRIRASLASRVRDADRGRARLLGAPFRYPRQLALVAALTLFVGSVFAREWRRVAEAPAPYFAEPAAPVERPRVRAVAPPPPRAELAERSPSEERPAERRTAPHAAPQGPPPLDLETAALNDARDALHRKEPVSALQALDAYDARFRAGTLNQEARALRISALCEAGRAAQAKELGRQFLRRWPHSPLAARVESTCGGPSGAPR